MWTRSTNNPPAVNLGGSMSKIPLIGIDAIGIRPIPVGHVIPKPVLPTHPPITATPYPTLDMPGCVRAKAPRGSKVETFDDSRHSVTLCDGAAPVLETHDSSEHQYQVVEQVEEHEKSPETNPGFSLPNAPALATGSFSIPRENRPCPDAWDQPVGSLNKMSNKTLVRYELQERECVKVWEPVPVKQLVDNYLPDAGPVVSIAITAGIATSVAIFVKPFATAALKVAELATAQAVKKINSLLGRKVKPESLQERRQWQRRRNQALQDLNRFFGK